MNINIGDISREIEVLYKGITSGTEVERNRALNTSLKEIVEKWSELHKNTTLSRQIPIETRVQLYHVAKAKYAQNKDRNAMSALNAICTRAESLHKKMGEEAPLLKKSLLESKIRPLLLSKSPLVLDQRTGEIKMEGGKGEADIRLIESFGEVYVHQRERNEVIKGFAQLIESVKQTGNGAILKTIEHTFDPEILNDLPNSLFIEILSTRCQEIQQLIIKNFKDNDTKDELLLGCAEIFKKINNLEKLSVLQGKEKLKRILLEIHEEECKVKRLSPEEIPDQLSLQRSKIRNFFIESGTQEVDKEKFINRADQFYNRNDSKLESPLLIYLKQEFQDVKNELKGLIGIGRTPEIRRAQSTQSEQEALVVQKIKQETRAGLENLRTFVQTTFPGIQEIQWELESFNNFETSTPFKAGEIIERNLSIIHVAFEKEIAAIISKQSGDMKEAEAITREFHAHFQKISSQLESIRQILPSSALEKLKTMSKLMITAFPDLKGEIAALNIDGIDMNLLKTGEAVTKIWTKYRLLRTLFENREKKTNASSQESGAILQLFSEMDKKLESIKYEATSRVLSSLLSLVTIVEGEFPEEFLKLKLIKEAILRGISNPTSISSQEISVYIKKLEETYQEITEHRFSISFQSEYGLLMSRTLDFFDTLKTVETVARGLPDFDDFPIASDRVESAAVATAAAFSSFSDAASSAAAGGPLLPEFDEHYIPGDDSDDESELLQNMQTRLSPLQVEPLTSASSVSSTSLLESPPRSITPLSDANGPFQTSIRAEEIASQVAESAHSSLSASPVSVAPISPISVAPVASENEGLIDELKALCFKHHACTKEEFESLKASILNYSSSEIKELMSHFPKDGEKFESSSLTLSKLQHLQVRGIDFDRFHEIATLEIKIENTERLIFNEQPILNVLTAILRNPKIPIPERNLIQKMYDSKKLELNVFKGSLKNYELKLEDQIKPFVLFSDNLGTMGVQLLANIFEDIFLDVLQNTPKFDLIENKGVFTLKLGSVYKKILKGGAATATFNPEITFKFSTDADGNRKVEMTGISGGAKLGFIPISGDLKWMTVKPNGTFSVKLGVAPVQDFTLENAEEGLAGAVLKKEAIAEKKKGWFS